MFFYLKIIERTPEEIIEDGELKEVYYTLNWDKQDYYFDILVKRIEDYQAIKVYVDNPDYDPITTKDNIPKGILKDCVRVQFDNGSFVYTAYKLDKFRKDILPEYERVLNSLINPDETSSDAE